MLDGQVMLDQFAERRLGHPRVLALASRMRVVVIPRSTLSTRGCTWAW
jgi:2-methylcitrate dehydratase PrpD